MSSSDDHAVRVWEAMSGAADILEWRVMIFTVTFSPMEHGLCLWLGGYHHPNMRYSVWHGKSFQCCEGMKMPFGLLPSLLMEVKSCLARMIIPFKCGTVILEPNFSRHKDMVSRLFT